MAEVTKGDVTKPGDEKPQGEATALNESLNPVSEPEAQTPETDVEDRSQAEGVALRQPGAKRSASALSEDEGLLLGPTRRPDVPLASSKRQLQSYGKTVPKAVYDVIPYLVDAARDPDAPPQLHRLVRLLAVHLGRP